MQILITGGDGRLGSRCVTVLSRQGHTVVSTDADTLDITDFHAVRDTIHDLRPEIVIHCAAWTDVDACALQPHKAIQINGLGAQNVAVAAHSAGAAMLYVSSNEVFNGEATRPYYEYDPASPANPYGYSKLYGERAVAAANPRHYIVRTSWLFAHGGRNFIHAILNAAEAGKPLRVVTDEVANPTYNNDLADAIAQLIATERYGTYHLVNEGACSRYQFARYVLDSAGYTETPIQPITRHQWKRPSVPPLYCALANLAGASVGVRLRPWQAAVAAFLAAGW